MPSPNFDSAQTLDCFVDGPILVQQEKIGPDVIQDRAFKPLLTGSHGRNLTDHAMRLNGKIAMANHGFFTGGDSGQSSVRNGDAGGRLG